LKRQRRNIINWTPAMDRFLIDNNDKMTNKLFSDHLKIHISAVLHRRLQLGLSKMEMQKWTEEQTQFLIDNYQDIGDKQLAEIFNEKWYKKKGWTLKHIEKKRLHLKLKRTDEQVLRLRKMQGDPIGNIHIQNHSNGARVMVKTEHGYVPYAPVLWQQHNGPIPEGYCITFKNGDPLKCELDNLEMVSRTELMHRIIEKMYGIPRDISQARKLIKQLNKQIKIKKHERQKFSSKAA
jgi:hypothetical protein